MGLRGVPSSSSKDKSQISTSIPPRFEFSVDKELQFTSVTNFFFPSPILFLRSSKVKALALKSKPPGEEEEEEVHSAGSEEGLGILESRFEF